MKFDVEVNKLEQKRYDEIKKSGRYLELDVLIGAESEEYKGRTGKMPVVTTCMHGCKSSEISALYMILGMIREHLEDEYPMECIMADIGMSAEHLGVINTEIDPETNSPKGKHSKE